MIDLQKLYDQGKLKVNDEFLLSNGEKVYFLAKAERTGLHTHFVFEGMLRGICTFYSSGSRSSSAAQLDYAIVKRTPKKKKVWANFYKGETLSNFYHTFTFDTKEMADLTANDGRIACVEIDMEVEDD